MSRGYNPTVIANTIYLFASAEKNTSISASNIDLVFVCVVEKGPGFTNKVKLEKTWRA
jgi:hypothetical protein